MLTKWYSKIKWRKVFFKNFAQIYHFLNESKALLNDHFIRSDDVIWLYSGSCRISCATLRTTSPTIVCISRLFVIITIYRLSPNLPEDAMCVNQTSGLPYTLCSRRLHTANTILLCTEDTACACSRLQGETTQGRTSLAEVLQEHLVTIIPFLSTGAEHFGQGLVDSCRRSNEARSHLPLRDASSSTTKS